MGQQRIKQTHHEWPWMFVTLVHSFQTLRWIGSHGFLATLMHPTTDLCVDATSEHLKTPHPQLKWTKAIVNQIQTRLAFQTWFCLSFGKNFTQNWSTDMTHWICFCTVPKATGLLSCLQMKIVSFRIKPKWMQHLKEVRLKIPWRSLLSAEMNDVSAWRIGVPVAQNVIHLQMTSLQW